MPNGLLGALLKTNWPGLYRVDDESAQQLARPWDDYEVAPHGTGTAASAVINKFWVRHLFKSTRVHILSSFVHS